MVVTSGLEKLSKHFSTSYLRQCASPLKIRAHEEFEKPGSYGFQVNLDTLISCVTDTEGGEGLPHLSFQRRSTLGDDLLQASVG